MPKAAVAALLVNPTNPGIAETFVRESEAAAGSLGLQLHILQASAEEDFEKAFERSAQLRVDALVIMPDVFFNSRSKELGELSLRHRMPSIFEYYPFAAAGGLISYSSNEMGFSRGTSPATCPFSVRQRSS
jgi:DNA-binding LacI/PurR family transcriptional regulator